MIYLKNSALPSILFGFLILLSVNLFAMPQGLDPNTPIKIESDTASVEQISQQAIYEGNVIMTQGTQELRADKLTIKKDPKGGLNVFIANGVPAHFVGKIATDLNPVYATAKTIYYYPDKQLVLLEGAATLMHQHNKFQGPTLSYQLDKQIISANKQSNERPTVIIHPQLSQK